LSRAASRAAWIAGNNSATRMPMIAVTTNNSTSVKPRCGFIEGNSSSRLRTSPVLGSSELLANSPPPICGRLPASVAVRFARDANHFARRQSIGNSQPLAVAADRLVAESKPFELLPLLGDRLPLRGAREPAERRSADPRPGPQP